LKQRQNFSEIQDQFAQYYSKNEKDSIFKQLESAQKVLDDDSNGKSGFEEALENLSEEADKIFGRIARYQAQAMATQKAKEFISNVRGALRNMTIRKEDELWKELKDLQEWITTKENEQTHKPFTKEPTYTAEDVYKKMKEMEVKFKKIVKPKDKDKIEEEEGFLTMGMQLVLMIICAVVTCVGLVIVLGILRGTGFSKLKKIGKKKEKKEKMKRR